MATSREQVLPVPTQDERTMAMLAHVLAIFSSFIAPLVIYLLKKDSRFVSFHSLQVLIWHAAFAVTCFVGIIIMFIFVFSTIAVHPPGGPGQPPPLALFGAFGVVWLLVIAGGVLNVILGIVYAIKANRGEWARYPLIGNFVLHKILPERPVS